ncbi:MAG: hypothetical protein GY754_06055 [bacterium]|nr:hypothetical protein [bacterium]
MSLMTDDERRLLTALIFDPAFREYAEKNGIKAALEVSTLMVDDDTVKIIELKGAAWLESIKDLKVSDVPAKVVGEVFPGGDNW